MPASRFLRSTPVAVSAVMLALGLSGCGQPQDGGGGPGQGGGMPPTSVTFMTVASETLQLERDYTGRLHGWREAEVRARVGGILEERLYEEGARVEEGMPLFRIEQQTYRIALQRAQAELANAQAALNQAQREWRRIAGLHEKRAVSDRERDQALSTRELAEARLALASAGVAQAKLELEYTTVLAPVGGITGPEAVTPGNLLAPGALLTTVTQLDPIQVRFSLPAADAESRRRLADAGVQPKADVRLLLPGGRAYEEIGSVDFTAGTVDPRTGSGNVRAVFPNPAGRLVPGALARVQIPVERLESVHLVDAASVSQGPAGPMVFVVDGEDTARARPVTLGPTIDGRQVVLEGLADGDRVVVNGQVALRDGARVQPQPRDGQVD
jgi:membrane fusion protein, multidrug efflux system